MGSNHTTGVRKRIDLAVSLYTANTQIRLRSNLFFLSVLSGFFTVLGVVVAFGFTI